MSSRRSPWAKAPVRPSSVPQAPLEYQRALPSTPPPTEPPQKKSSIVMIYGIAAAVVAVAVVGIMVFEGGKQPETKPVAPSAPLASSAVSTSLSGTFMLDVKDATLSGGEGDFKLEAFKDHFLVRGWFPGSNVQAQSILSWNDVQVAAGEYDVTFTAGSNNSREFDLQLNVDKGRLSVNNFRPDTASVNASKDFPVGRIKLSSTASGVNLVCTKWSLSKPGMDRSLFLRRIRFSPVAGTVPAAADPPPTASIAGPLLTFASHRYQFISSNDSWTEARDKAAAAGGHLATITSKEEDEFINRSFRDSLPKDKDIAFIGGIASPTPDWTWVTGEDFVYRPSFSFKNGEMRMLSLERGGRLQWKVLGKEDIRGQGYIIEWDDTAPAKAAPIALTTPVNLLALVDVKRDAVYGDWEISAEGLNLKHASGTKLLGFNQSPPEEYDFEIEFTLNKGHREVIQVLPVSGGKALQWRMGLTKEDPALFAFGPVLDGKTSDNPQRTEAVVKLPRLAANQRYRSTVEVRKGSLRALLDGNEVLKWTGDFRRFAVEKSSANKLRDASQAGVGGYDSGIIFHKAELRPLSTTPAVAEEVKPAQASPMTAPAPAEPVPPADPRLTQLETGYQSRYDADAQKPFLAAVAALNQSYVANGITRARAAAQAKGSLTEINALDAEKTAVETGGGVPAEDAADTPESLKTLRGTYRTVLAQHAARRDAAAAPLLQLYLSALDAYVAELTKAGKIEEARQVQALRDAKAQPPATPPAEASSPTGSGYTNSLGMKFVPVKGTNTMFCIHETRRQDYAAYAADNPSVNGSWKTANRNGIPVGDKDDHPVVNVSWDEAHQFCEWLSKKEGKTYRLPTDEEWSIAVGIGSLEERVKESTPESLRFGVKDEYPWGGGFPPKSKDKVGNYKDATHAEAFKAKPVLGDYDDGFATTAPVMSFKPNKLGIHDLGGNVDEWVEDWYNATQKGHAIRGMNWMSGADKMSQDTLSSGRSHGASNRHDISIGFRVVLEAPKKAP